MSALQARVRTDRPWLRSLIVVLVATTMGCNARPVQSNRHRGVVRVANIQPGTGAYLLVEGLIQGYRQLFSDIEFDTFQTNGAVATVQAIQRGEAHLALVSADVAYLAYEGRLDGSVGPFDQLSGIATLQPIVVHLIVGPRTGIRQVGELRGRRIGIGPLGSSTMLASGFVLQAFGIDSSVVHTEMVEQDEALRRLVAGTLDAMVIRTTYPSEVVTAAARAGAQVLALTGAPIDRLRRDYPFFKITVIPRNTYPGIDEAIRTVGVDSVLICRTDLDETVVYDLTRGLFELLPSLPDLRGGGRFLDLEGTPATVIPLHSGAVRHYRERELLQ